MTRFADGTDLFSEERAGVTVHVYQEYRRGIEINICDKSGDNATFNLGQIRVLIDMLSNYVEPLLERLGK